MAGFSEEPIRKAAIHEIGVKLDDLSVAELDIRIEILRREIIRLEVAKSGKEDALKQASSFFKS